MKTIDEAAKEAVQHRFNLTGAIKYGDIYEQGFKAGAYIAHRWIPVEEELPEKKDHGFSDQVLAKDKFGNIKIERYDYEFNHFNEIRYDAIETGDGQVTHWRPIELK